MEEPTLQARPDAYSVKLPVFEGPLDLLLHLIRQEKIDIYDIPISTITREYLTYIEMMKELNLELASEFLVMAATLIYIKSRMLLPPDVTEEGEAVEDPRAMLVERLLEYQSVKERAAHLREREEFWSNAFHRKTEPEGGTELIYEPEINLFDVNLFDLMGALQKIIKKLPPGSLTITRETLTVQDRINSIIERLEKQNAVQFDELFDGASTRRHVVVTFLALLEMLRIGFIRAYQSEQFGAIWITRRSPGDDVAETERHDYNYDSATETNAVNGGGL